MRKSRRGLLHILVLLLFRVEEEGRMPLVRTAISIYVFRPRREMSHEEIQEGASTHPGSAVVSCRRGG
jgi:hypothetical protein